MRVSGLARQITFVDHLDKKHGVFLQIVSFVNVCHLQGLATLSQHHGRGEGWSIKPRNAHECATLTLTEAHDPDLTVRYALSAFEERMTLVRAATS